MSKTLKQLAQEALNVQDACNLCAVAQGFARTMIDLGEHTRGTDERNSHPITRVWLDKLNQLAGIQEYSEEVTKAYTWVVLKTKEIETCDCGACTTCVPPWDVPGSAGDE